MPVRAHVDPPAVLLAQLEIIAPGRLRLQRVHAEPPDGSRLSTMALEVDWDNASVSPTATGLLWVEVEFGPVPEGTESRLLSQALGELS
jgi:hypothetical protein